MSICTYITLCLYVLYDYVQFCEDTVSVELCYILDLLICGLLMKWRNGTSHQLTHRRRCGFSPVHGCTLMWALSTTIVIIIIMMIIIITAFKGAVRDFIQSLRCTTNYLQHVHLSGQGTIVWKSLATHRAPITCNMLCTTWYERTAQLLSLTELKSHLF